MNLFIKMRKNNGNEWKVYVNIIKVIRKIKLEKKLFIIEYEIN